MKPLFFQLEKPRFTVTEGEFGQTGRTMACTEMSELLEGDKYCGHRRTRTCRIHHSLQLYLLPLRPIDIKLFNSRIKVVPALFPLRQLDPFHFPDEHLSHPRPPRSEPPTLPNHGDHQDLPTAEPKINGLRNVLLDPCEPAKVGPDRDRLFFSRGS